MKPISLHSLSCALAVALVAGCGPKEYDLKFAPRQGETYHYALKLSGAGLPTEIELRTKTVVDRVDEGTATMTTTVEEARGRGKRVPASALGQLGQFQQTTLVNPGGQLASGGGGFFYAVNFRNEPVSVGATWTGNLPLFGQKVGCRYKLVGIDQNGGKQLAHLTAKTSSDDYVILDAPAEAWVEVDTGMLVRYKVSGSNAANDKQRMSLSLERLP